MRLDSLLFAALSGLLLLAGCSDDPKVIIPGSGGAGGGTGEGGGAGGPVIPPTSTKAMVKFKNARRLRGDLSRGLGLPPTELCKELKFADCIGLHKVSLLDTDAEAAGIYEPMQISSATTPLSSDRIVLAACGKRVDIDLEALSDAAMVEGSTLNANSALGKQIGADSSGPGAGYIFQNLPVDASGALSDPDSEAVSEATDKLYRRALGRKATESEIANHRKLYDDIVNSDKSSRLARDWAVLSCFATFTTLEFLFY